jgi:hypothetical protein
MNRGDQPSFESRPLSEDAVAARQRRLGTALHHLAIDLARERRRTAQLERELARLRIPNTDDRGHRT